MSANDLIYNLGQTNIVIAPAGNATQVLPPRCAKSVAFKYASGGSLSIMNGPTGASPITGYLMSTTEVVSLNGPVTFFLAATGATATASILFGLSAGHSALP